MKSWLLSEKTLGQGNSEDKIFKLDKYEFNKEFKGMLGIIYYIKNLKNDKLYIGKTFSFLRRQKEHKIKLNNNKHHNQYLQNSWNKYGKMCFEFGILFKIYVDTGEYLNYIEKKCINFYHTNESEYGYNLTNGGEGVSGYKHTKEELDKISKANKGRVGTFLGKNHTEETKKMMSEFYSGEGNGMFGKQHSEKSKIKISNKMKFVYNEENVSKYMEFLPDILEMLKNGFRRNEISKILKIPPPAISVILRKNSNI